jgi:hypothetical protein
VRGTTTILCVFKANAPQFVYQKQPRPVRQDRMPTRSPEAPDSRPAALRSRADGGIQVIRETARSPCR